MKVSILNAAGVREIVSARVYAFPKKGNAPADYNLKLGDEPAKVAMTGGGKYPKYVYLMINGVSHYLPKDVVPLTGSLVVVEVEPVAAPTEPVTIPTEPVAPTEPVDTPKRGRK